MPLSDPKPLAEGETFRMGAITKDVSAESIKRIDHQLQIECAHRGWDYVPVYYETEANYNDAFMSDQPKRPCNRSN